MVASVDWEKCNGLVMFTELLVEVVNMGCFALQISKILDVFYLLCMTNLRLYL